MKLTHEHFCLWPEGAAKLIDENTIGELPPSLSHPCSAIIPVLLLQPQPPDAAAVQACFVTPPPACGRQQ